MSAMRAHMDPAERSFCSLSGVSLTILEYPKEGDLMHTCIRCGAKLVVDENTPKSTFDRGEYICRDCLHFYSLEYGREQELIRMHRSKKSRPMGENKTCAQYLGVHIAERVLSHVFKDVKRMPYGNPGYDVICNRDKMIDIKSSCRGNHNRWIFVFNKNQIADYFLCLAFDNRENLNPEHIWLIPAGDVNHKTGVTISMTTLGKWSKYELPIDQVVSCCDTIKGR